MLPGTLDLPTPACRKLSKGMPLYATLQLDVDMLRSQSVTLQRHPRLPCLFANGKELLLDRITLSTSLHRVLPIATKDPANEASLAFFYFNKLSPDYHNSHHSFFLHKKCCAGQLRTGDFSISCTVNKYGALNNWATGAWKTSFTLRSVTNGVLDEVFVFACKALLARRIEIPTSTYTILPIGTVL